ncbi:cystathione beta-lyase [Spiroplasma chinense]|uniref:cysteine-S-conjugate beta-lyase n=1 Tax=Spiroplasma chinense TaxID=216932 RepID=A0A5B9Y5T9_9MOLU|nr:aminotransferase class I/II-fold pyridoxal phosphate-dependent enzyme [Spiroplasma chinense]QEH61647.1 cystathione beta-lyase [Spiroplasma chinense]
MENIQKRIECSQVRWDKGECRKKFGIEKEDHICLWIADSDLPLDEKINKYLENRIKYPYYGYTTLDKKFEESFLDYHKKHRNQTIKMEEVFFTPGTVVSFSHVVRAISKKQDGIAMCTPIYGPLFQVSEALQRRVEKIPLLNKNERFYLDFEKIEETIKQKDIKIFVIVNPLNPSGRVWERSELEKLVEICKKYNVYIISDEIHCDLVYEGKAFTSMLEFEKTYNRFIVLTSVNKTFNIAGVQVGWGIVKNKEILELINIKLDQSHIKCVPNIFAQALMEGCFKEGDDFIKESMNLYKTNYDWLKNYLNENANELTVMEMDSTFLPYICFKRTGISLEEMKDVLWNKAKVIVQFNDDFVDGGCTYFRINVATDFKIIQEAAKRICNVINEYKGMEK